MYTFRKGAVISNDEKIKIIKLYKQINITVPEQCNKSDEMREVIEELLVETVAKCPAILYVIDENGKSLIDLVVKNKLWGALFEIAKKQEFADIINEKLEKAITNGNSEKQC